MKTYERKYIDLENGERIAYIEEGKGDKIILGCHGNYSSCQGMYYLIEQFAKDYKVIIPDNRGFGDSSWNKKISTVEDFAHDIVLFCKAKGIKKAIVVGHSFGGGTAMEIAIQAPEMVEKLVLIAPTSVGGYPLFKKVDEKTFLPFKDMDEMRNDPLNKPVFDMLDLQQKEVVCNFIAAISPSRASDKALLEQLANETLKERCLLEACWALCTWNITSAPGAYAMGNGNSTKIVCPVFLATAGKDTMVFPFMNDLNAKTLGANGKLTHKFYENASHAIYEDVPDQFFGDVKKFLG